MFKPRGFTIFGYHCSDFVFLSKSEILDAVKTGQRLGVLCRKAAVFLSMNIMWKCGVQRTTVWIMNSFMLFLFWEPFSEASQLTQNVTQSNTKCRMSFYNWKRFVSNNVFVYCCCQRDLFNQLLIHAAMKSENKHHQKLGRWGAAGISGFMLWGVFPPISVCFCECAGRLCEGK